MSTFEEANRAKLEGRASLEKSGDLQDLSVQYNPDTGSYFLGATYSGNPDLSDPVMVNSVNVVVTSTKSAERGE